MELNITILIQSINFFLAYTLLRYFFFKPIFAVIKQEEDVLHGLKQQITVLQDAIYGHQQQKTQDWQRGKVLLKQRVPCVTEESLFVFKKVAPEVKVLPFDAKAIKEFGQKAQDHLIQRIQHDIK